MWSCASVFVLVLTGSFVACKGGEQHARIRALEGELEVVRRSLDETRRDLDAADKELENWRVISTRSGGCASCCNALIPQAGDRSLFLDHNVILELGAKDVQGGPQQKDKRIAVDDVLFGYDVLFEERKLFMMLRWKGMRIEQDPSDAFAIQDFLWQVRPDVLIEFGTMTGGSAVFFAELMLAYNPNAHVITLDPFVHSDNGEVKARQSHLWGTTIRSITGYPSTPEVRRQVDSLLHEWNATNVFLNEDSNHIYEEVLANLRGYQDLVKPCGWILVQDTRLSRLYGHGGPIKAARTFVQHHPSFQVKRDFEYLLYTQHAQGWMQRLSRGRHRCPELAVSSRMTL